MSQVPLDKRHSGFRGMFGLLRTIRRSVKYKVMAVVLAATLVALFISALALLIYEANSYRDFLVEDAATQADLLSRMAAPALQFQDPAAANQDLSLLASKPGIVAAAVYADGGERFAVYAQPGAAPPAEVMPQAHGPQFSDGKLELYHPVEVGGQTIGTVYIRSADNLSARLLDYLLLLAPVMLLSLGAAWLVSIYLQRSVSRPVLTVSAVARRIMHQEDFSLRAPKTTEDEIGVLVDSFNTMLARIGRITRELEDANRALQAETEERAQAEAALRAADARKDEFLATLAHELRNPLAPMLTSLEILDATREGPDAEASRAIIRRQLMHMVRLIDDLLDVSRITRGKLDLQREPLDICAVLSNAVETATPFIESRGHALSVKLPEAPVFVDGDAVRLSQVVGNLLHNAAKYTPPGGRIELTAAEWAGRVEIRVTDTGIGFSADDQDLMFEMFTQAASTPREMSNAGLGVGLGLARRLVAMHGGTIEASSPGPGRGSTFVVTLHTVARPGAANGTAGKAANCELAQQILLVDDNEDFASSLAILLKSSGHAVVVAHDGASALELARTSRPAVAFLDLGLPDLSGFELATRIRALAGCEHTVLVAVSGWGQEQDLQRSSESGFAAHLVKPVNVEQIREVMVRLATTA